MKTLLIAICFVITASAHATDTEQRARSAQLVQQAASYPYLFRQGDTAVAPKAVALLEEATRLDADNAEGWTALGVAHQMQLSAAIRGGKLATLLELALRVRADYERAVQLDPDHAAALAGHGSILTILAGLQREPRWFAQGQAELNRAVQLQPSAVRPRLLRAFTSVNLPASMRELPAIENDVRFLIEAAGKSRPAAMLHVLLGDIYAELGRKDLAQREYRAAPDRFEPVAALAGTRLTALLEAGVPAADIAELRGALSTRCTLCHAP